METPPGIFSTGLILRDEAMNFVRRLKKIAREQRLERERAVGRPRAKSWSGRADARSDRRTWKKNIGSTQDDHRSN